ncbi:acylphosphatase [Crateriforma conspicua]|uniref:acylphosphatase n=1 Tax=Crateriforma conspicua TaxID=2527996 RepID=A0A5C5Y4Y2_9PLAN|nr:acylphosphatase [Crateriforma conspicua]TWT68462.1 Acylphosphatase [Crateriforma conspicua]
MAASSDGRGPRVDDRSRRVVVTYRGHVQGVGFRATAVHCARGLAVDGFVQNLPNGDVRMDVQGPRGDVDELMRRIGMEMSGRIDDTLVDPRDAMPPRNGFRIRY